MTRLEEINARLAGGEISETDAQWLIDELQWWRSLCENRIATLEKYAYTQRKMQDKWPWRFLRWLTE